jgi:TPR repeat protein
MTIGKQIGHFGVVLGLLIATSGPGRAQDSNTEVKEYPDGFASSPALRFSAESDGPRRKYGIVVGNTAYSNAPHLPNAWNDAQDVASLLAGQGYEVILLKDASKRDFEKLFQEVLTDVDRNTEVLFYFAGHGVQVGAENYLIPVDALLDEEEDLPFETVSVGSLVSIVGARARLQVIVLDSCRNNPFAGVRLKNSLSGDVREVETGFASLAAPVNSLLVYSTSPGEVALDGEGENSPFAAAFLASASQASVPVKDVFEQVRRAVFIETEGMQVPWDSSTLLEEATIATVPAAAASDVSSDSDRSSAQRGLTLITSVAGSLDTKVELPVPDVRVELNLASTVVIGDAILPELGAGPEDIIDLIEAPTGGRLVTVDGSGNASVPAFPMRGADLATLAFAYSKNSIEQGAQSALARTQFRLELNGVIKVVEIVLVPDPCDVAAGDYLDPEGAGFARFPNEIEPQEALDACKAAVAKDPQNPRFHYQLGRVFTALRMNDEARAEWEIARDLGYTRASYAIGNAIINEERETGGSHLQQAPDEALAYFREGVELGDPYAFYSLGRQMVRFGETDQEKLKGFDLMMRSLEVGHTFAMNELGYFYLDEESEYFDPDRGLRYLNESAARGDIYGYNNLGLVFMNGLGGKSKEPTVALDWFTKASDGGHPNAPGNIGQLIASGALGNKYTLGEAVKWLDLGLERGDANAGAYGAYVILTEGAGGLGPVDAAYRAGRTAALRDPVSVERARKILEAIPAGSIDEAAQLLLQALGAEVNADGDFGAGSEAAYQSVAEKYGSTPVSSDPVERLVHLARIHWATTPFRVDLY